MWVPRGAVAALTAIVGAFVFLMGYGVGRGGG